MHGSIKKKLQPSLHKVPTSEMSRAHSSQMKLSGDEHDQQCRKHPHLILTLLALINTNFKKQRLSIKRDVPMQTKEDLPCSFPFQAKLKLLGLFLITGNSYQQFQGKQKTKMKMSSPCCLLGAPTRYYQRVIPMLTTICIWFPGSQRLSSRMSPHSPHSLCVPT